MIGIYVDYPQLNKQALSGTIGKVNNYRNTKVTEADILLKNELVTDTAKLKMLQNYFNFYYVGALKMTADVELAVKETLAVEAFQIKNKTLTTSLDNYGKFLLSARTKLLMALAACKTVKEADPIELRNVLNQGRNVVAQIDYRDRVVFDFVEELSTFIKLNKPGQYEGLEKAHDLLVANEIYTSLITKNKVVLKFLDKTALFSKSQENLQNQNQQKLKSMILLDVEKLGRYNDAEKLQGGDAEKLGRINDTEKLGWWHTFLDAEKLSFIAGDAEKLGASLYKDIEKLACDAEKLGVWDAEKLGYEMFAFDAEKLGGGVSGLNNDTEKLGTIIKP